MTERLLISRSLGLSQQQSQLVSPIIDVASKLTSVLCTVFATLVLRIIAMDEIRCRIDIPTGRIRTDCICFVIVSAGHSRQHDSRYNSVYTDVCAGAGADGTATKGGWRVAIVSGQYTYKWVFDNVGERHRYSYRPPALTTNDAKHR